MRRRTEGQSLVEMAFILPLLLVLLFGIIDLGYYIYGYATIYQAARNGAEQASMTPPYPEKANDPGDRCVGAIVQQVQSQATLFRDLTSQPGSVRVSYPGERRLGEPVEVTVTYNIEPLTPLWRAVMFGNNGRMTVTTTTRRSIESFGSDPNAPSLITCSP